MRPSIFISKYKSKYEKSARKVVEAIPGGTTLGSLFQSVAAVRVTRLKRSKQARLKRSTHGTMRTLCRFQKQSS